MWAWLLLVAHGAGLLTSIRAVMDVRTPQGAIAWVMALNAIPLISVPAYWVFGGGRFQGYLKARRRKLHRTQPVADRFFSSLLGRKLVAEPDRERTLLVEKLSRAPLTTGNDVELLVDGEATFRSIFEGIEGARDYLLVEYYSLRDDKLGREFQRHLIEKARKGVPVRLVYDGVGSAGLPNRYLNELRRGGVKVHSFNTARGRANRWQLNFRNHRKIVIADGRVAWVGGHNVGDEHLGRDPCVGCWRDTHVKITGPAVHSVQVAFMEDWQWATGDLLELNWDSEPAPGGQGRSVVCLPSGPGDDLETCTLFFLHAINSATRCLWIASPYFVPDEQSVSALQLASLRGVDVRVLMPERTDSLLVNLSGWSYLTELEKAGVRVFRYTAGFMHQKVMLVDDRFATVGSANFDNRSFRLNFEITAVVLDKEFAGQIREMLERDFAGSREVFGADYEKQPVWRRFLVRAARLLAPIQ